MFVRPDGARFQLPPDSAPVGRTLFDSGFTFPKYHKFRFGALLWLRFCSKHRPRPNIILKPPAETAVSRRAGRGRRNRRLRKEHAALFAEALARNRRVPDSFHGMEFVAAGEVRHATRQAAAAADAHDVFAAARGRFCRSLRAPNSAAAARRLPGAGRPLHLHRLCARRGARLLAALAAESLQLRARSGHHLLFPRAARCGGEPDCGRPAEAEILRSGDGPGNFAGSGRKLPHFPGTDSERTTTPWSNRITSC